jgi:hypothetical protein
VESPVSYSVTPASLPRELNEATIQLLTNMATTSWQSYDERNLLTLTCSERLLSIDPSRIRRQRLAVNALPPDEPFANDPFLGATGWLADIMAIDSSYSSGLVSELGPENQPSEHNPPTNTSTNDIENALHIASLRPAFSVASLLQTAAVSGSITPPFPGILDDAAAAAVFADLLSGEDLAVHVSEDLVGQKRYICALGVTINF